jgi:pyruvate kinase
MTRATQTRETTAEQRDLLATLVALRGDVMAEGDKLLSLGRDLIRRLEYLESARNLACYLALRRRDLRTPQMVLIRWGLSSLGRDAQQRALHCAGREAAGRRAVADAGASEQENSPPPCPSLLGGTVRHRAGSWAPSAPRPDGPRRGRGSGIMVF